MLQKMPTTVKQAHLDSQFNAYKFLHTFSKAFEHEHWVVMMQQHSNLLFYDQNFCKEGPLQTTVSIQYNKYILIETLLVNPLCEKVSTNRCLGSS